MAISAASFLRPSSSRLSSHLLRLRSRTIRRPPFAAHHPTLPPKYPDPIIKTGSGPASIIIYRQSYSLKRDFISICLESSYHIAPRSSFFLFFLFTPVAFALSFCISNDFLMHPSPPLFPRARGGVAAEAGVEAGDVIERTTVFVSATSV